VGSWLLLLLNLLDRYIYDIYIYDGEEVTVYVLVTNQALINLLIDGTI